MSVLRDFSVIVDFDDGNLNLWAGLSEIGFVSGTMEIDVREQNYAVLPGPVRAIRDGTATVVDASDNIATLTGEALSDLFFESSDNGAAGTFVLPFVLDFTGQGLTNVPAYLRFDLVAQHESNQYTTEDISPNNGDAEDGTTGWTVASGTLTTRSADPAPAEGTAYFASADGGNVNASNTDEIAQKYHDGIDAGTSLINLTWQQYGDGTDTAYVFMELLDSAGSVLKTVTPDLIATSGWVERSILDEAIPAGTRFVKYRIAMIDDDADGDNIAYIDNIQSTIETLNNLAVIDPIRVRLYGLQLNDDNPTDPVPPGGGTPTDPTEEEEIEFRLGKIDVSEPKITALQENRDVTLNAHTMVANIADFKYEFSIDKVIPLGERGQYKTVDDDGNLQYFRVTHDSPGLRDGRVAILTGFSARDARSHVPVTLTFRGK